jgi:hypothetical protein
MSVFAVPLRPACREDTARLGRNRHLAKGIEAIIASTITFLYVASIMLLTRRVAR